MAHRCPARVVAALGAGHLGHLGFYDLGEDLQADCKASGEQALAHPGGEDLELAFGLAGEGLRKAGFPQVNKAEAGYEAQVPCRGPLRV